VSSRWGDNRDDGRRREPEVEEAFSRLVSEGSNRLDRPLVPLLATLAANLVGGLVMAGLIAVALPDVRSVAATLGHHDATLGIWWRSLLLAPHRVAEERADQS
jgi:hypothetical protein